ncbi:MAG: hypothetical protein SGJ18_10890 [Pseudomonadota bacterium]|nr:hypothetical protein [Pseudomonadota bacterium]
MKKILLLIAVSLAFGCSSEDKKTEPPATATKATPAPAKKSMAGKGFADEDISKLKPGQPGSVSESTVSCKGTGDDVRTIEVAKEGTGCKVDYTRSGSTQTIATAATDFNYCDEKRDKVRANLEGAGFKCE